MGELIQNLHTFVVPHSTDYYKYTFEMDWEYMGETYTSIDENGNTEYHAQDGKSYNSVSLNETKISYEAQLKEEYPNTYILYHDSKNYGPSYIPDYVGISINGCLIVWGSHFLKINIEP